MGATTKKLTVRQQRFVDEYLIDLNATQAAVRAGYTATNANVIGPGLVNVGIVQQIQERQKTWADDLGIIEQYILTTFGSFQWKEGAGRL